MGFSGIGIWEILLILIVAFIVLGPNRLPGIARTLGKTVRAIKKAGSDFTASITRELEENKKEPPPQPQKTEPTEAPSAISTTNTPSHNNQPANPERHQQQND